MNQKREMPENIRKMFEQRKLASNNSSSTQNPEIVQQPKEVEEAPLTPSDASDVQNQEQIEENADALNKDANLATNEQPASQPKQTKEESKKEKKEKKEKVKKEKPQKGKSKLSKKTKTIIIISSIVLVLAIAIVLVVTLCISKTEKMQAPTLKVYSLSNEVMIYVDENENADYYEFYYQEPSKPAKRITDNHNYIYLRTLVDKLGSYTIWARYGSKNEKMVSDISNKEKVTYTKQLDRVENANLDANTKVLTFSPIAKAISYRIYYGVGENEFISQAAPNSSSIDVVTVNLANKLKAGNYNLMIQAIASTGESSYYTNSELSKSIEFIYKTQLEPVKTATFKKSTSTLKLTLNKEKTNTNKFKINITFSTASSPLTIEKQFDSIADSQVLDLSQILSKYSKTASEVASISVVAVGGGYIEDSSALNVTIND